MSDLEDVHLARLAEERHGVSPEQVHRARARVESGSGCFLRELFRDEAISPEAYADLARLRDESRPGGHRLSAVLGSGTSATVYSARRQDGHEVALKVFHGDARDGLRAGREARALALLDHPV